MLGGLPESNGWSPELTSFCVFVGEVFVLFWGEYGGLSKKAYKESDFSYRKIENKIYKLIERVW